WATAVREALGADGRPDRGQVAVGRHVVLQTGQEQEQPAPEGSGVPPFPEGQPASGEGGHGVRGVFLRGPLAGYVKHCSPLRLTCRSSPLSVNVPALVDHATWCRPRMVTLSACWPNPPA